MGCSQKDRDEALAFARKMVEKLREQLIESSGIQSVASDGVRVTYSPCTLAFSSIEFQYWEKQVILLSGDNSQAQTIDLSKGL